MDMRHIKKLALLLLIGVMVSGTSFAAFINPSESTIDAEKKGLSGRKMGDQAAVVLLVRNSGSSTTALSITANDVVVYDTNSDDGVSVRLTTTSADGAIAGIAVSTFQSSDASTGTTASDDYGRRNWGYILVHGKTNAKTSAGGTNGNLIGDLMITSKDSGAVTFMESVTTNDVVSVLRVGRNVAASGGFFYDAADGTSTSYEVQVDLE